MSKARGWPENANKARLAVVDALEDTLDSLVDLTMAIANADKERIEHNLKRSMRLQNYGVKTLIDAKHGVAPEKYPEEIDEEEKK
jgi:hypothetical protein